MKDLSKGLKVGALSGIIYGSLGYLISQIIFYLSEGLEIPFYVISSVLIGAIFGLILGIIVGIIFAVVYKWLPGTTSLIKGIIFSIFILAVPAEAINRKITIARADNLMISPLPFILPPLIIYDSLLYLNIMKSFTIRGKMIEQKFNIKIDVQKDMIN